MGIFHVMILFGLVPLLEVGIVGAGSPLVFNVLNFGAKGNGVADDTQIEGTVIAPNDPRKWRGIDPTLWLQFESVSKLNVSGSGEINGRGQNWWKQSCKISPKAAIKFADCSDLWVTNLRSVDSQQFHISILNSQRVTISNLKIVAPGLSPNTDGIHIQNSQHVRVEKSVIGTGDDCISIGTSVYDVHIEQIACGPGHGISIGSLGKYGTEATVEDVFVRFSNFYETTNGVRIKTWQGGKGFARGISFEHCNFTNVDNPIIIDQYYCDGVPGKCKNQKNTIRVSNVTYSNLQGTSRTPAAISLNCSQSVPCNLLQFDMVNLISSDHKINPQAYCINAHGNAKGFINPKISCLQ
ncbi:uncharacterized protein A4U43_C01F24690 [Asparagus officinalis]|uniref:Polygalacturonase n=1 Tax=Asparagus officinalis TaxID=4686 RepID=A0A5P1FW12_ASPOF|nr:uncharacterized protein A4U43_C01F24690 [Asparagus officinalis]